MGYTTTSHNEHFIVQILSFTIPSADVSPPIIAYPGFRSSSSGKIVSWNPPLTSPECCGSYRLELTPSANSSSAKIEVFNTTNNSTTVVVNNLSKVDYSATLSCQNAGVLVSSSHSPVPFIFRMLP